MNERDLLVNKLGLTRIDYRFRKNKRQHQAPKRKAFECTSDGLTASSIELTHNIVCSSHVYLANCSAAYLRQTAVVMSRAVKARYTLAVFAAREHG